MNDRKNDFRGESHIYTRSWRACRVSPFVVSLSCFSVRGELVEPCGAQKAKRGRF